LIDSAPDGTAAFEGRLVSGAACRQMVHQTGYRPNVVGQHKFFLREASTLAQPSEIENGHGLIHLRYMGVTSA
jgi:hypothetical protein